MRTTLSALAILAMLAVPAVAKPQNELSGPSDLGSWRERDLSDQGGRDHTKRRDYERQEDFNREHLERGRWVNDPAADTPVWEGWRSVPGRAR